MELLILLLWMVLNIVGFWVKKRFFGMSQGIGFWGILYFFIPVLILVGLIAWDPFISIATGYRLYADQPVDGQETDPANLRNDLLVL